MDEKLRQYIIQELDLTVSPEAEVDEVITSLGGIILQMVILKVADSLNDENVIIFEKILAMEDGEDKEDRLVLFMDEHVPNLEEITTQCSKEVIEEYKKL